MNDMVRMGAGVVLLVAVAGIALFVLMPGDAPPNLTAGATSEHAATTAPEPSTKPKTPAPELQPMPVEPPPPDDAPLYTPEAEALLEQLEAVQLDPAEENDSLAFRTYMSERSKLYRQLEQELKRGISVEDPDSLIAWAEAQVALGDTFAQTVIPQGLTAKQTESYLAQTEERARGYFDEALALLDRAEAADPAVAERVLALRKEIQAR